MLKIRKSTIERIIREEFQAFAEEELKKSEDDYTEAVAADEDNTDSEPTDKGGNTAKKVGSDKEDVKADKDIPDEEVPAGDDPADDELSKDVEEPNAKKEKGSKISDDVIGKQIQSLTAEKNSKLMPGATEIILQFENAPQPLRILIGRSGVIKYFYKGTLRNEL